MIKLSLAGLNNTKKWGLWQTISAEGIIKSTVTLYEYFPDKVKEISSCATSSATLKIDIPDSENEYFIKITSDFFHPFVSQKFKADEDDIFIQVEQYDKSSAVSSVEDIPEYLLVNGWKQTKNGWESKYKSCLIEDVEKAFFFEEFLKSQEYLLSNIDELRNIKETNPSVWENFCWKTFSEKTKSQWNEFVTESIMEELDG